MDYDHLDDHALVDGILNNDGKLMSVYHYIINVFDYRLMERFAVTADKKSLIKNAPNDWSREMATSFHSFPPPLRYQRQLPNGGYCKLLPKL